MKVSNNVKSTARTIPYLEVNVDTVYVRTKITDVSDDDNPTLWNIGREEQYEIREFIELISEENRALKKVTEEYLVDLDFRLSVSEMGM